MAKLPKTSKSVVIKKTTAPKKVSLKEYARRREVWLKALESGKYEQTRHVLEEVTKHVNKYSSAFCCLGVACKVLGTEVGVKRVKPKFDNYAQTTHTQYGGDTCLLPIKIAEHLGLRLLKSERKDGRGVSGQFIGTVRGEGGAQYNSLVSLNDDLGYSFMDIAKFVRDNPGKIWAKGTYKNKPKNTSKSKRA